MARIRAALLLSSLALLISAEAGAVVQGSSSSLHGYTVRLSGNGYCTGVVIARRLVATAAHCASRAMRVHAGGRSYSVVTVARHAMLDDGRRVATSGDAAILRLATDLPTAPALVGPGSGESFTIAGYGTTDERWRGSFGSLHEATLIAAAPFALVDPQRTGSISASACFGDSGGPVLRGGELIGVITRAAHPSPRIACGHLTRWAPVTVSGEAGAVTEIAAVEQRKPRRKRRSHSVEVRETSGFFWPFGQSETKAKKRTRERRDASL
jgi:hypothetical protein